MSINVFVDALGSISDAKRAACLSRQKGLHQFFRLVGPQMQSDYDVRSKGLSCPTAFIHGNPHLDNFAISRRGAAMVDFDRSRKGPYSYDIVRFLSSLSMRAKGREHPFLAPEVLSSFYGGYTRGLRKSKPDLQAPISLTWHRSQGLFTDMRSYVDEGRGWADRINKAANTVEDSRWTNLLSQYDKAHPDLNLFSLYRPTRAASIPGSMGKLHHVICLEPQASNDGLEPIIVDFKETYREKSSGRFKNPFSHQGKRMLKAGELHAPDWELYPAMATHDDTDLWVRQIPAFVVKLKKALRRTEQIELARCVGRQLGRAHRLSTEDSELLKEHVEKYFEDLVFLSSVYSAEIADAHRRLIAATLRDENLAA